MRESIMTNIEKEIRWMGSSYDDLLQFPADARREAGFQLSLIQACLEPKHWRPFTPAGIGVRELRLNLFSGAFRVMYTTRFDDAIYVMHCFKKTTQVASHRDKEITTERYSSIVHHRGNRQ